MTAVLDASVFIASFAVNETHHALAARIVKSIVPEAIGLVVPAPFLAEVGAGLSRKVAATQMDPAEAGAALAYAGSARFRLVTIDSALARRAAALAWTARIRGYDAIYAAVALAFELPLLTFDLEFAKRCRIHFPKLLVFDHTQPESDLRALIARSTR